MKGKKMLWLALALVVAVVLFKRAGWLEPTNICATRPDHPDISLRTRVYKASRETVRAAAIKCLSKQRTYGRAWKTVETKDEIRAEVFVLMFVDDVTIAIEADGDVTRVDVRSQSRVGRGDFGENRRHVWQLLRSLDLEMDAIKNSDSPSTAKRFPV